MSVSIVFARAEFNRHLRLSQLIVLVIHKYAAIECLHIDGLAIFDHCKLLVPLSEMRLQGRLIPHIIIYRREKIQHPLMWQFPFSIIGSYICTIYLTYKCERILFLLTFFILIFHHWILHLRWQIRIPPPLAAAE